MRRFCTYQAEKTKCYRWQTNGNNITIKQTSEWLRSKSYKMKISLLCIGLCTYEMLNNRNGVIKKCNHIFYDVCLPKKKKAKEKYFERRQMSIKNEEGSENQSERQRRNAAFLRSAGKRERSMCTLRKKRREPMVPRF